MYNERGRDALGEVIERPRVRHSLCGSHSIHPVFPFPWPLTGTAVRLPPTHVSTNQPTNRSESRLIDDEGGGGMQSSSGSGSSDPIKLRPTLLSCDSSIFVDVDGFGIYNPSLSSSHLSPTSLVRTHTHKLLSLTAAHRAGGRADIYGCDIAGIWF
ncbi:hypothetical protein FRC19_010703 [Serendipita sp. 401]|nr:hypothetical protein FRC19_010703 [Serendipita sp. 401]